MGCSFLTLAYKVLPMHIIRPLLGFPWRTIMDKLVYKAALRVDSAHSPSPLRGQRL